MVQLLFSLGTDTDAGDLDLNTLHVAALKGHAEVVKVLLNWGCDPNVATIYYGGTSTTAG